MPNPLDSKTNPQPKRASVPPPVPPPDFANFLGGLQSSDRAPVSPAIPPQQPRQPPPSALPPTPPQEPSQPKTMGERIDAGLAAVTRFAEASASRFALLDRKGKILVGCGGFAAIALLALVVGGLSHQPGDTNKNFERSRNVPIGKHQESIREQEKKDRKIRSPAALPDGSPRKDLTKAQKEQIRLRLQALYAALYSLPTSGPVDELPNIMQQQINLTAEISRLEALLADPAEP